MYAHARTLGLKRIVNLLSGYPDSKLHGYPTDSDLKFNINLQAKAQLI